MLDFSLRSGDKIKIVRQFRGWTQKQLADAVGLGPNGASRIAQYEMNYRNPKESLVRKIGDVLGLYSLSLVDTVPYNAYALFQMLLWMDEIYPDRIHLTYMGPRAAKGHAPQGEDSVPQDIAAPIAEESAEEKAAEDIPSTAPWCDMHFEDEEFDDMFREWAYRKQQLKDGAITEHEYREWKFSWPMTRDRIRAQPFYMPWREEERQYRGLPV